eukprot:3161749-Amphidinium_carterae.1
MDLHEFLYGQNTDKSMGTAESIAGPTWGLRTPRQTSFRALHSAVRHTAVRSHDLDVALFS